MNQKESIQRPGADTDLQKLLFRDGRSEDLAFIQESTEQWQLDDEHLSADQFLIVEDPWGRIAGFGRIKGYESCYELGTVGVRPEWRAKGLGMMIVNRLVVRFPSDQVWITTDLISYFERFGFQVVETGPKELMEKISNTCRVKGRQGCKIMLLNRGSGTQVPSFSPRDFGKAAEDYAAYRKGFPYSFFDRLAHDGIGKPGQRSLDIGTGTGTLARGFAKRGVEVTGLDISPELLEQARKLSEKESAPATYILGRAEDTRLPAEQFDVITAGQCWLWFDGPAAAKECMRLLKPGGSLIIAHFCYLPEKGNVAARTEELILKYNPAWPLAGSDGRYEKWKVHMEPAGFRNINSWFYDEDVSFTHEEWRGRFRACNGVLALRDAEKIRVFDQNLAQLLRTEFHSGPLEIPHRIFVIQGQKPC